MSSSITHIPSNIFVKKCSYFLAIINREIFVKEHNAERVGNSNIYMIKKDYDGSSTGETCAVLGLDKWDTLSLLSDDNNILQIIKDSYLFNYIESIDKLSINLVQNTIKYFAFQIDTLLKENDLIIFNIEPKGQTKRHLKFYPVPNLSIPGGNMENEDNLCIEKCGEREFYEETGINIVNRYKILARNREPLLKVYSNEITYKNDKKRNYSSSFPNCYSNYRKFTKDKIKKMVRIEKYFFLVQVF